jgi:ABC-2 type transport system ATP-binding protein
MEQDAPIRNLLSLEGIVKYFVTGLRRRRLDVLQDITLTVERGEIFALLGANGAGKSTLLKIILGLIKPSHGTGVLLDRPLGDRNALARIGYQPEQPYLYPTLTAWETLDLLAGLSRMRGSLKRQRIDAVVDCCSLASHIDKPVRKLSRGWLQRLTLAGALLPDPDLLFLDEPLGGLDPEARLLIKNLLRQLRDEGKTIFLNSHLLPDVETLADRVAMLCDGRIVVQGRIGDLLAKATSGAEIEFTCPTGISPPEGCEQIWERAEEQRQLWRISNPSQPLEPVLSQLIAAGARIEAIHPIRPALEELFVTTMGSSKIELSGKPADRAA